MFPPDKDRSAIARPAAIGRMDDEADVLQMAAGALEITSGKSLFGPVAHENSHELARRDLPHDFAIDPADGVEFVRPIRWIVWPAQPGGFVRFRFRRHRVAKFGGRG